MQKDVKNLKKQLSNQKKELTKHKTEIKKQQKIVADHRSAINEHKRLTAEHKKQVRLLKEERAKIKKLNAHLKKHADNYLSEMKKALSTAILAAFAFLMALSWREYIADVIDTLLEYSPINGKLISAILVTIISVLGIVIVTRMLKVKD